MMEFCIGMVIGLIGMVIGLIVGVGVGAYFAIVFFGACAALPEG